MIGLNGRNFLSTLDFSPHEVRSLVQLALQLKRGETTVDLAGLVATLMFFAPSVRTRISCQSSLAKLGGTGIVVNPGSDAYALEIEDGVVMDGATAEHVKEVAPVVSRLCDWIGIRKSELVTQGSTTADVTTSYDELKADRFINAYAKHATVPVINLESNSFHPLQGLADMATMVEKLGEPKQRKYVLTWAWHPKSLPVATPHSQLLAAADLGMEVTVLRPPGYSLDAGVMAAAKDRVESLGGSLNETDDIEAAYRGADVVCAKSWGSLDYYGRFEDEPADKAHLRKEWVVDEPKMDLTGKGIFMHCLPVRRNIVVTDGVLDGPRSAVVDQAGNRLWTAGAVFAATRPEA